MKLLEIFLGCVGFYFFAFKWSSKAKDGMRYVTFTQSPFQPVKCKVRIKTLLDVLKLLLLIFGRTFLGSLMF